MPYRPEHRRPGQRRGCLPFALLGVALVTVVPVGLFALYLLLPEWTP